MAIEFSVLSCLRGSGFFHQERYASLHGRRGQAYVRRVLCYVASIGDGASIIPGQHAAVLAVYLSLGAFRPRRRVFEGLGEREGLHDADIVSAAQTVWPSNSAPPSVTDETRGGENTTIARALSSHTGETSSRVREIPSVDTHAPTA